MVRRMQRKQRAPHLRAAKSLERTTWAPRAAWEFHGTIEKLSRSTKKMAKTQKEGLDKETEFEEELEEEEEEEEEEADEEEVDELVEVIEQNNKKTQPRRTW